MNYSQNSKIAKQQSAQKSSSFLMLIILVGSLLLSSVLMRIHFRFSSKAQIQESRIFFSPASLTLNSAKANNISLILDAKTSKMAFVRISITFDSDKIKLSSPVQLTTLLKTVVKSTAISYANQTGNYTLVLALSPEDRENPPSGIIEIAKFSIKAVNENQISSTSISTYEGNTQLVEIAESEIPFTSESLPVTISSTALSTATPVSVFTATPIIKPTVTSAVTPTLVPTIILTSKPTVISTVTPVPTQKPVLKQTSTQAPKLVMLTSSPTSITTPTPVPTPPKKKWWCFFLFWIDSCK